MEGTTNREFAKQAYRQVLDAIKEATFDPCSNSPMKDVLVALIENPHAIREMADALDALDDPQIAWTASSWTRPTHQGDTFTYDFGNADRPMLNT